MESRYLFNTVIMHLNKFLSTIANYSLLQNALTHFSYKLPTQLYKFRSAMNQLQITVVNSSIYIYFVIEC